MIAPGVPGDRLAIVMVGLPARGKTYIAQKIARYLTWLGHRAQVFNVGSYRRERLGKGQSHDFFDPLNPAGLEARRTMAMTALDDVVAWLATAPGIAIYDATNSTIDRREMVAARCRTAGIDVLFVESVCEDPTLIDTNVRQTKLSSPDYAGVPAEQAVADFLARIAHYEAAYQPLSDAEGSYITVVDVGRQVVVNRIHGYLPGRIVVFLMNLHIERRPIWLTRHGESLFNVENRVGGDAGLSPRGEAYAERLGAWLDAWARGEEEVAVWTSTLQRTRATATRLSVPSKPWKNLDEIDAGVCDGLTYPEIEARFPEDAAARRADKLSYRYPRGESYEDVIQRLDPVIIELERERRPTLVIAHQAILRALVAYFVDKPIRDIPHLDVPLHTVIELTPKAYGCEERRIALGP